MNRGSIGVIGAAIGFATANISEAGAGERGFSRSFSDWKGQLDAPATTRNSSAAIPGVIIADGTRFLAEGAIGSGYDSNIDHRVTEVDGGVYGLVDLGLAVITGAEDAQTTAVLRGGYGYHDIDYRPDRWDAGVLIDHYGRLSGDASLNFGAFFLHDDIDVDANERAAGYYQLSHNGTTSDAFWRGRILDSHYLIDANTPPAGNRFFSRDETFDHVRVEQSVGGLILKDQRLAPYFEIGYANLDYTHEINPAAFSRDADEVWAIGGVRVTLSPQLHVDLGARYNERRFDDPIIDRFDSVFFDGKIVWTPSETLYVEFNADRSFLEPVVDTALMTESTTFSLLTVAWLDELTKLKVEVGHITEDQIGAPDEFQHLYTEARLTRLIAERTEIFASVLAYHTRNDFGDLEADRVDAMAGIRIHN